MARVRVKICGLTNEVDALEAVDMGADAIGFNFYLKSPRFISEEQAADIVPNLPPFVEPVALFVNETFAHMMAVCQRLGSLHTIQVHGDQLSPPPPSTSFRFIPAFGVKDETSLASITQFLKQCAQTGVSPAAIILDASVPGLHGGTGQSAPWRMLADFQPDVPIILAGGLTPENVAEAIRIVKPYAVDVASGVEKTPGVKDFEKMRRFIEAAKTG